MHTFSRIMSGSVLLLALLLPAEQTFAQCDETKLTASDGTDGDRFGDAIAINRNLMAVSADDDGEGSLLGVGSAYLFQRIGGTWMEVAKFVPSDARNGQDFGQAIALERHFTVVTAPHDKELGGDSGAAYVFARDGAGGFVETKLHPSDAMADQQFGESVAAADNRIVVGARDSEAGDAAGAAYVFRYQQGTWVEEQKLISQDIHALDVFGYAVAMGDRRIAVGALGAQTDGVRVGAVYVFSRATDDWVEEAKLVASDPNELDFFGNAVAITRDGTRIVAGAYRDDEAGFDAGAAYVFHKEGGSWVEEAKLIGDNTVAFDSFGISVAIAYPYCVVGAPNSEWQGAAYLFKHDGVNWNQVGRFEATDETEFDDFGTSVAVDLRTLAVGAPLNPFQFGPGAVYVYDPTCTAED